MENEKWKMFCQSFIVTACATSLDPSPRAGLPIINRVRRQNPRWQRHYQPVRESSYVRLVHQPQLQQTLLSFRTTTHLNSILFQDSSQPGQARGRKWCVAALNT